MKNCKFEKGKLFPNAPAGHRISRKKGITIFNKCNKIEMEEDKRHR